jgi:hypothetical protein
MPNNAIKPTDAARRGLIGQPQARDAADEDQRDVERINSEFRSELNVL